MASLNTLTGLMPVIYNAVDVVSREQVGAIMAANRDASYEQAYKGQVVRSPVAPKVSASDITPGAYAPDSGGQTISYVEMAIDKFRKVEIQWTGEEQGSVGGANYNTILGNQFAQAFRQLSKEIATDINAAALAAASRATGAAGTVPFATANDLSDFAAVNRILDDNGAPLQPRYIVLNSGAMQNLRGKQSELFKVNEAGTEELLRNGSVGRVQGLWLNNDTFLSQSATTVGTGTSYVVDGTGNTAVGSTVIKVKTGSGTILAGDVITIGGFKYVVQVGLAAPGTLTINNPGLVAAIADGNTVTIESAWRASYACSGDAIQLAVRAPAMPSGGDAAADVMMVTDPKSGLVYQIALYKGYRQMHIEVAAAWGVKANKSEHISLLLG